MKQKKFNQWISTVIIICLCLSFTIIPSVADETVSSDVSVDQTISLNTEKEEINDYGTYLNDMKITESGNSVEYVNASDTLYKHGDIILFESEFNQTSIYELCLTYCSKTSKDVVLKLTIDATSPFSEAEQLTFPSYWVDSEGKRSDDAGNEFAADQILYNKDVTVKSEDYSGRYEKPFIFGIEAGTHTIQITVIEGELNISSVRFAAPEKISSYKAPTDDNKIQLDEAIVIEGEEAELKSDRSLIALSDSSSPQVSPSDSVLSKLNYIGGSNWKQAGSKIFWSFDVEKEGYYKIGFSYRQNQLLGGVSYRHLMIDGKTPFTEAEQIKFTYNSKWKYKTFGDDEPYLIYLSKGKHTLALAATAGPIADIYSAMQDVTLQMGDLYVDITKIVGETVDIYRSYELFNQIPEFNERLDSVINELNNIVEKLQNLQEKNSGSTVSTIQNAARVVKQMIDNPYSAHRYKSSFYDSYANLSALVGTLTDMPLDIDRIFVIPSGNSVPSVEPSLLKKLAFSCSRFLETFSSDYSSLSDNKENGESLSIWVNWGRDQAQVLNAAIQDSFVRDTGIGVEVKVVNATLVQAILAGKGPDCMLQMARTEPVNLAMRGALYDLSSFDDLDEVTSRFTDDSMTPYKYQDGIYALPDTQSFYMMYVRTDILNSLGLEYPKTWKDYINISTILQRNNLQAYLPYTQITDSGTVNSGVGGLSLYPTLLMQNGLKMYNSENTESMLSSTEQIQIFNDWVYWYTKYKFTVSMDFYNRFRIGNVPIGIAPITLYTQLKATAPEIDGRWILTAIPGIQKEDGSIYNPSAGSGTGCSITKLSKSPENAWKFLKWWTSAETQLRYSNNLESVLGAFGRVATSNTEAFASMDWGSDMLDEILNQREKTVEIEEVPGGYYTARGIDQAFWGVVEQGRVPTEMMMQWAEEINSEISRKRNEYIN